MAVKKRWSQKTRDELRVLYEQGAGTTELAQRSGVPATTVSTWATADKWIRKVDVAASADVLPATMIDARLQIERAAATKWKFAYRQAARKLYLLEKQIGDMDRLGLPRVTPIPPRGPGESETTGATVFAIASDWHVEEIVEAKTVNGLNEYNPEIAKTRATAFWRAAIRLCNIIQQDVRVDRFVVGLLGDFITNELHEDSTESNAMTPVEAIGYAQDLIASGLTLLREQFEGDIEVVCHSGNHGRTTKLVHSALEHGHSLEFFMYMNLAKFFREQGVMFSVPQAYHSYAEYYGHVIRFHHGHGALYKGGVGGLYIPVNKAIAQWDKSIRANLDVFGHFHSLKDGGKFLCNGSLIGYNGYALRNKFDYEPPRQLFFVVDSKHGRTCTWPILVEDSGPKNSLRSTSIRTIMHKQKD